MNGSFTYLLRITPLYNYKFMYNIYNDYLGNSSDFKSFFFLSGTRIIYERAFLMNLKNSPLSRTPPSNVPSGLLRGHPNSPISPRNSVQSRKAVKPKIEDHQEQFEIDL